MSIIRTASFALTLLVAGAATAAAQFYDEVGVSLPALTNSVTTIKAASGPLLWYSCNNPNAATVYVQFFDTASSVVLGTTAPTLQWTIPPGQTGVVVPQRSTSTYYAANSMQAAVTSSAGGSGAPSSPLACTFGIR